MGDLIDRDETIKQFCKQDCDCDPKDCLDKTCYEVEIIESVPTHATQLTDEDKETIRIHLNAFKESLCNQGRWYEATEYEELIHRLLSTPSVQPRKWIYGEHESAMCDGYRCDKCGFFVPWDYQHKFIDFIKDYNYCPSCGAYMGGDSNEID